MSDLKVIKNKATRLNRSSFKTPQMRAFHISRFAFFLFYQEALTWPDSLSASLGRHMPAAYRQLMC